MWSNFFKIDAFKKPIPQFCSLKRLLLDISSQYFEFPLIRFLITLRSTTNKKKQKQENKWKKKTDFFRALINEAVTIKNIYTGII